MAFHSLHVSSQRNKISPVCVSRSVIALSTELYNVITSHESISFRNQPFLWKNATWRWSEPTCKMTYRWQLADYQSLNVNLGEVTNYFLVWILVKWQTDRRTDRQKAMQMSPPFICTGVLNKLPLSRHKWLQCTKNWLQNSKCQPTANINKDAVLRFETLTNFVRKIKRNQLMTHGFKPK